MNIRQPGLHFSQEVPKPSSSSPYAGTRIIPVAALQSPKWEAGNGDLHSGQLMSDYPTSLEVSIARDPSVQGR